MCKHHYFKKLLTVLHLRFCQQLHSSHDTACIHYVTGFVNCIHRYTEAMIMVNYLEETFYLSPIHFVRTTTNKLLYQTNPKHKPRVLLSK